jgi:hypothetical protein
MSAENSAAKLMLVLAMTKKLAEKMILTNNIEALFNMLSPLAI